MAVMNVVWQWASLISETACVRYKWHNLLVSKNKMIEPFKWNTVSYKMNPSPSYEFPQSTLEMQPYRLSFVWRYVWSSSLSSPHQVS